MSKTSLNALWRVRNICAYYNQFATIRSLLRRLHQGRNGKHVGHVSDHLARDIGLSPAEIARHRHVWPSQSANHPRL